MKMIWKNIIKTTIFTSLLFGQSQEPKINNEKLANIDNTKSVFLNYNSFSKQPKFKNTKEKVYIIGLGDVDFSILNDACEIVENFYGYNGVVVGRSNIDSKHYFKNTDIICADSYLSEIDNESKKIIITNKQLYSADGTKLRGYTYLNGKNVLMRGDNSFLRETLIHEVGHTLGLRHCDDLSCIMAINNDEEDSGDFCNKCKKTLNIE
jgi:hypothetical protein